MKANTYNDGSVSVIIPLYNHERYVGHALESVFAQSAQPLEIIVVDDGSCDRSVAVVRALAAARPEIVFWSRRNQGAHYTLNAAIHRARGEFVAILNPIAWGEPFEPRLHIAEVTNRSRPASSFNAAHVSRRLRFG